MEKIAGLIQPIIMLDGLLFILLVFDICVVPVDLCTRTATAPETTQTFSPTFVTTELPTTVATTPKLIKSTKTTTTSTTTATTTSSCPPIEMISVIDKFANVNSDGTVKYLELETFLGPGIALAPTKYAVCDCGSTQVTPSTTCQMFIGSDFFTPTVDIVFGVVAPIGTPITSYAVTCRSSDNAILYEHRTVITQVLCFSID